MKEIKHTCTLARLQAYKRIHAYTLKHLHAYTPARLHALTLIELMIVCAIIAVLVGIVWVVMAPVREKARLITCTNNLKQIGLAYQLYRQRLGWNRP